MKIGIALVIIFLIGGFLGSQYGYMLNGDNMFNSDSSEETASAEKEPMYWVAPMDKNYRRDGPGLSPMGMDLVPVYAKEETASAEKEPMYWVAPMDKNYRRDGPGLSPMGMDLVPVYAEENSGGEGDVFISAAVENNLGVKTAKVTTSKLYRPIDTVGTVQFDESKIHHIHSRVEGWIEVLNVSSVGDTVKKGQTLYELYSPALVNAQEEYLAALRSGNKNLINASKSRLLSLGLDDSHAKRLEVRRKVDQRVKMISDVNGVVINLRVREGMFIKPATEVISIGSLDSVWIIGEVFERQSYLVNLGQEVDIHFNAIPGKHWQGELSYIYPELDASTRTLLVRVNIDNPEHILKPNMLANFRINANQTLNSLSIPKQALIKSNEHTRVVKALGEGNYQSVLVEVGFEGLDESSNIPRIQILKGLKEGDRVVTSAQFLIDSESNIDAELARMESETIESETVAKDDVDTSSVMAMGIVNSVMAGHNMLNITHQPVPEWGWPDMTMNFDVESSLDLKQLNQGEAISFMIKKYSDGSIAITEIMPMKDNKGMNGGSLE
jgi:Cu(I)/Ag(I) efflux system membrane fusion protein